MKAEQVNDPSSSRIYSSQLSQLIFQITLFLKRSTDEYELKYAKILMNELQEPSQVKIEEQISEQLYQMFWKLKELVSDMEDFDRKTLLQNIMQKILDVQNKPVIWWEAAQLLLKSKQIKKMRSKDYTELCDKLKTQNASDINDFLAKLFYRKVLDPKLLDQEAKKMTLKSRPVNNIKTLIAQIVKTRPDKSPLLAKFQKNQYQLQVFSGHHLEIINEEDELIFNGKIVSGTSSFGAFHFIVETVTQGNFSQSTLTMYYNQLFIDEIQLEIVLTEPLRRYIGKQFYKMGQTSICCVVDQCQLTFRFEEIGKSMVIPEGAYKVIIDYNEQEKIYELTFQDTTSLDTYMMRLDWNFKENSYVVFDPQNRDFFSSEEFQEGYLVKWKATIKGYYKSPQENSLYLKLTQGVNTKGKVDLFVTITRKKNQLIHKILNLPSQYFNQLIKAVIYHSEVDLPQFEEDISEILTLYSEADQRYDRQVLFQEVMADANYASIINKQYIMSSIRAVQLFVTSQNKTSTMIGKEIIAFFGNTGAGKSTAVNYFKRTPLVKKLNNYGQIIVEISSDVLNSSVSEQCKIGHSSCISETLYSQGYTIAPNLLSEQQQHLSEVVFCDNPGFNDTRGTAYDICTNLSMDRAIESCKNIKAIVLVVPYQTLELDRGSNLIKLLTEMQSRFPKILDPYSLCFSRFFVLISKMSQSIKNKKYTIRARFEDFYTETKNEANDEKKTILEVTYLLKRVELFRMMVLMCQRQQVDFIDIDDTFEREEILEKYNSKTVKVSKSNYVPTMMSKGMLKQFSNQISVVVHSWTRQILEPYFDTIPKTMEKLISSIESTSAQISENQKEISRLEGELKSLRQQYQRQLLNVKDYQVQCERVKREDFTKEQRKVIELSQEIVKLPEDLFQFEHQIEDCQQVIKNCKQKLDQNQIELERIKNIHQDYQIKIKEKREKYQNNRQKMKKWMEGSHDEVIIKREHHIDDVVQFRVRKTTKEQRLYYLEKGQQLPFSQIEGSFIAGKVEKTLSTILKVSRQYNILPTAQFDPNDYISRSNIAMGNYLAKINARKYILEGVKLDNDGKSLLLSVQYTFTQTKSDSRLPYLQIIHTIPNKEIYAAALKNTEAENRQIQLNLQNLSEEFQTISKKRTEFQSQVEQLRDTIALKSRNIARMQKQNALVHELKEKRLKSDSKYNKIDTIKKQKQNLLEKQRLILEMLKETIEDNERSINKRKTYLDQLTKNQLQEEKKLEEYRFKSERLSFLIYSQLKHGTLQIFKTFIQYSIQMCQKTILNQQTGKSNKEAILLNLQNYKEFLNIYKKSELSLNSMMKDTMSEKNEIKVEQEFVDIPASKKRQLKDVSVQQEEQILKISKMKKKIKAGEVENND